ncbi:MAG: hypothetical protein NVS4B3_10360 [Gemmatimonadaceae bacterium]
MAARQISSPTQLAVVRAVFILTVLVFGAYAWRVHHSGAWSPPARVEFERLRQAGLVVWGAGIVAIVALTHAVPRIGRPSVAAAGRILAWATGEAIAVFGAIYYLRTSHPQWYLLGGAAMLASLVLVPITGTGSGALHASLQRGSEASSTRRHRPH